VAKRAKIKIDTSPLDQIEAQLANLDLFLSKKNEIMQRICTAITPLVRRLLLESLHQSDLHKISGELESFVGRAIVVPTSKGIRICAPRGLSQSEYAKMGALQYGWLNGIHGVGKISRKKIKAATAAGTGPSGSKFSREHPYFVLNDSQVRQVEAAMNAEMQKELDRFLAYQNRGR
jgi:hypothetical protein